ncbi:hypothetical protein BC826DRAFT_1025389, partial [Russula brevipes]
DGALAVVRTRCDDGAQGCCCRTPCSSPNATMRSVSAGNAASDALTFSGASRMTRASGTHGGLER